MNRFGPGFITSLDWLIHFSCSSALTDSIFLRRHNINLNNFNLMSFIVFRYAIQLSPNNSLCLMMSKS